MSDTYVDINSMETVPEFINAHEPIESADYTPFEVTPVGLYLSNTRTITLNNKETKKMSIKIELTGGVTNLDSGKLYNAKYPLRAYLTDTKFEENGKPGTTSQIARYLRAFGFDTRGMSKAQCIEALKESANMPVEVYIGRTDSSTKDSNGGWVNVGLKTKDFFVSDGNGGGHYVDVVNINGKTYKARPKVTSFSAPAA